jgi:hypothetical protein
MLAHLAAVLLAASAQTPPAPEAPAEAAPSPSSQSPATAAPTDADLARLRHFLAAEAEQALQAKRNASVLTMGIGVGLSALALQTGRVEEASRPVYLAAVVTTSGLVTGLGALLLLVPTYQEQQLAQFDALPGTGAERVLAFEKRMEEEAAQGRSARVVTGALSTGLGVVAMAVGGALELDGQARGLEQNPLHLWVAGYGALFTVTGIASLTFLESLQETRWQRYGTEPSVRARRGGGGAVTGVGVGPMGRDGLGVALGGRF